MILYHTGKTEIQNPDIHYGRKNADFGWGFYLTPDKDFAYRWAGKNAIINEYELDETGLDIYVFHRNEEWFRYIFDNRRGKDQLMADVIMGPIANDTIYDTLGIISSGFLKTDESLKLLSIGPEYTQVAIKTEKAAENLCFIRSQLIEQMDDEALKTEQDEYLEELAKEMEQWGLGE
ncbi:MAG: DUF3990 domain-containing protein [Lachnospiraceae bacterium]|nr:DUF3990 domain-containing protein [Lachnospiraceae bacterium]